MKIIIIGSIAAGVSAAARLAAAQRGAQITVYEKGGFYSCGTGGLPHYLCEDLDALNKAIQGKEKELAAQGPCVILGRCGDYVLRERPNVLRTFVYAPLDARIEFAKSRPDAKDMPDRLWETQLAKHDRARASYYNYYTENRWGEAKNYDLCLNATLGREACADLIVAAAKAMQEANK